MDWLDILLISTKGLAIVFAGGFAIMGLLTDFRDKSTQKVTRWGKVALIGILVSTGVSLVSQAAESLKARNEANTQTKRANATLAEIERAVSPLRDIKVNYQLDVPLNDPILAGYRSRLMDGVNQMASAPLNSPPDPTEGFVSRGQTGVDLVFVPWGSHLMPTDPETAAAALMRYTALTLDFYKTPIDEDTFVRMTLPYAPGRRQVSDLHLFVKDESTPATPQADFNRDSLLYYFQTKEMRIGTRQLLPENNATVSSRRMVAVPDLCESQLWVAILNTSVKYPATPLAHQMHLKSLGLLVGSRAFVIHSFTEHQAGNLGFFYSFTFPKTEEDLDRLAFGN